LWEGGPVGELLEALANVVVREDVEEAYVWCQKYPNVYDMLRCGRSSDCWRARTRILPYLT
jgi:hypothetical protein